MNTSIEHIARLTDSSGERVLAFMKWDETESNYRYKILWRSGRKEKGISIMTESSLRSLRKITDDSTDPEIEIRGDGLYRIYQTDPIYGPRGGYKGEQIIYWPDAYNTIEDARKCIKLYNQGMPNLKPSIRVHFDSGDVVNYE